MVILYKYFYKELAFDNFLDQIRISFQSENIIYFILAIVFMPLNWVFESAKWKYLISKVWKITWKQSIGMIFQGTSLGIITPGRVGEYGGRVLQLPGEYRAFGAFSTFLSSLSQNTINILGGIVAIMLIDVKYSAPFLSVQTVTWIMVVCVAIILVLYFLINRIWKLLSGFAFIEKRMASKSFGAFFSLWDLKGKWIVLGQSILRYLVYVLQYYFMLLAFGIEIIEFDIILGILLIFAIQTLLPLTPLLQFALRGSIAISILGAFFAQDQAPVLLAVSYSIWFLNLLIPGIVGAISMYWLRGKG